jgi:hypothetical protein
MACLLPTIGRSQSSPALPAKMHWCAVNCITLVLYQGHYVGSDNLHPEQAIKCGLFTVESFTRESVVMHRTDCEPPGSAVLNGKISASGNAIVDGTITWTSHPCCGTGSRAFLAAWGSEIDSIPGNGPGPQSYDTGQIQIENVPTLIDECEVVLSRKNCAAWNWTGADYMANWGDGTVAHITVQQWNRASVILQRSDYGADRSTATYKGRWLGDGSIAGESSLQWTGGLLVNVPTSAGVVADLKWTANSQRATNRPHALCDVRNPPSATSADLGKMMSDAQGAGDLLSAACWAYIGAMQGKAIFESTYGYYLTIGQGVAKNPQQAFEWTKKAADQGEQNALLNLKHMYDIGFGVARDAEKSHAIARDQLARLLARLRVPSGAILIDNLLNAADGCEQDPESARDFHDACAAVYQRANEVLRERTQSLRDGDCRKQATTPIDRHAYNPDNKPPDFSVDIYRQCLNSLPEINDRYVVKP